MPTSSSATQSDSPTPFNNFNQWATGLNGPIWKNHTFFDVDYEGLRNLLPTAAVLNLIPSPQFQTATLQIWRRTATPRKFRSISKSFEIYNSGSRRRRAVHRGSGGCGSFTSGLAASAPCAHQFRTTPHQSE